MTILNRLERAGWPVIAADMLGLHKGDALALCELVCAGGRVVTYDRLASLFRGAQDAEFALESRLRVTARIGAIRAALEDIGIPRGAIKNTREVGYAIDPTHAAGLHQMVGGVTG